VSGLRSQMKLLRMITIWFRFIFGFSRKKRSYCYLCLEKPKTLGLLAGLSLSHTHTHAHTHLFLGVARTDTIIAYSHHCFCRVFSLQSQWYMHLQVNMCRVEGFLRCILLSMLFHPMFALFHLIAAAIIFMAIVPCWCMTVYWTGGDLRNARECGFSNTKLPIMTCGKLWGFIHYNVQYGVIHCGI
jgi:hypothetical protein